MEKNKKPKALRLAEILERWLHPEAYIDSAAAELRRLHEVNQELLEALESLLEMTGEPPDWNCTCHLTPPCIDCVDYSGWRNAFKFATSVLAKATGEQGG